MNKEKFEIKTAELLFSEQDGLAGLFHNKPMLVWFIVFGIREGMDRDTVGILVKDRSVIKVDPATGKVLSRQIEIVR